MKTLNNYINEKLNKNNIILYSKETSNELKLEIPEELKDCKWNSFNFGKLDNKKFEDLDEAIDQILKSDGMTFKDIEEISYDGKSIVDVKYTFGNDKFGFSLKKI